MGFPAQFKSYVDDYDVVMFQNPCNSGISNLNCTTVGPNSILKKGVETSIFSLVSNGHQMLLTWQDKGGNSATKADRQSLLQSVYMSCMFWLAISIAHNFLIFLFKKSK